MQKSTRRRWALVPAALAVATWVIHKAFDHVLDDLLGKAMEPWMHYLYEYAVPAIFAIICLWILWPDLFPKGSAGGNENTAQAENAGEFTAMESAARQIYAEARRVDSYWALSAEQLANSSASRSSQSREDTILCGIANLIAGEIDIYGEPSPSTTRELIANAKRSTGCQFFGNGNTLRFLMFDKTVYQNMVVKTRELEAVLASLDCRLKTTTPI